MTKHKKTAVHHHENLRHHAKALVKATGHIADAGVSEARDQLSQLIDSLSETVEDVEELAATKMTEADQLIQANPYKTAGIAMGVGLLIGYLISRPAR